MPFIWSVNLFGEIDIYKMSESTIKKIEKLAKDEHNESLHMLFDHSCYTLLRKFSQLDIQNKDCKNKLRKWHNTSLRFGTRDL